MISWHQQPQVTALLRKGSCPILGSLVQQLCSPEMSPVAWGHEQPFYVERVTFQKVLAGGPQRKGREAWDIPQLFVTHTNTQAQKIAFSPLSPQLLQPAS